MTDPSQYELFTAEVVQAEQIPIDRDLTAEETERFTELETRLRAAWRTSKSDELLTLLRRMKAIRRARKKRDVPAPAPVKQPPAAKKPVANPRAADRSESRLGDLHRELSELAAKQTGHQRLAGKSLGRLAAIVNQVAPLAARDPGYRRVYDRALRIQQKALRPPGVKWRNDTGLTSGGREVLGGLPGTRRGH